MKKHLIIPDSHALPNTNMRRYEWLGKFIIDHKPDVIIDIGDWWDMPSLCEYDKGKKDFVFRNLEEDIESGHEAEQLAFAPIVAYNKVAKIKYNPKIYRFLGNHEARLKKMFQYHPHLENSRMKYPDCFMTRIKGLDMTLTDFQQSLEIDGISYTHYFVSGVKGQPASSARSLIQKKFSSATMGHVHTLDMADGKKIDGTQVRGLICGSYHDPEYNSFAGPQVDKVWWNGLILKHCVDGKGSYDREEFSVRRLQEIYGKGAKKR